MHILFMLAVNFMPCPGCLIVFLSSIKGMLVKRLNDNYYSIYQYGSLVSEMVEP